MCAEKGEQQRFVICWRNLHLSGTVYTNNQYRKNYEKSGAESQCIIMNRIKAFVLFYWKQSKKCVTIPVDKVDTYK